MRCKRCVLYMRRACTLHSAFCALHLELRLPMHGAWPLPLCTHSAPTLHPLCTWMTPIRPKLPVRFSLGCVVAKYARKSAIWKPEPVMIRETSLRRSTRKSGEGRRAPPPPPPHHSAGHATALRLVAF